MKKILALLLASVMALSLAACGGNTSDETTDTTGTTENNTTTEANPADAISDTMTSEDGTYELAFVTDVGQLKDKSFNEGTWNGVKLYANENDMSYKYYQPANGDQATDDDRYDAMKAAVDAGATVVVCAGFLQEAGHALLHIFQVLVRHAETLHQIVHRFDVHLTGAGQAVALLDGFAVLHPLDKDHGGSFFATDTKHWVPSLGDSGVFRPAGGGCPPRVFYSAAKAAPLRAQRGCISFPAAGSFGDTKRGNDMGIVSA